MQLILYHNETLYAHFSLSRSLYIYIYTHYTQNPSISVYKTAHETRLAVAFGVLHALRSEEGVWHDTPPAQFEVQTFRWVSGSH